MQVFAGAQELSAGLVFQMLRPAFSALTLQHPHHSFEGWGPSVQTEIWLVPSGCRQVPACPLEFVQIGGLLEDASRGISAAVLFHSDHEPYQNEDHLLIVQAYNNITLAVTVDH